MAAYTNRRAQVEADDPTVVVAVASTNPYVVAGTALLVRKGDIVDVGIDWTLWCKANDAAIKTSAWAAHGSSPKPPTFTSAGVDGERKHTVILIDASAAAVGDVYWLNNTVVFEDATGGNTYNFPDRTLVRTLAVQVTQ